MTDITNIKYYLEWRAEREGRQIDTSPEAWAHHIALEDLATAARHLISFDNESTVLSEQAWIDLRNQTVLYDRAQEALNAH